MDTTTDTAIFWVAKGDVFDRKGNLFVPKGWSARVNLPERRYPVIVYEHFGPEHLSDFFAHRGEFRMIDLGAKAREWMGAEQADLAQNGDSLTLL